MRKFSTINVVYVGCSSNELVCAWSCVGEDEPKRESINRRWIRDHIQANFWYISKRESEEDVCLLPFNINRACSWNSISLKCSSSFLQWSPLVFYSTLRPEDLELLQGKVIICQSQYMNIISIKLMLNSFDLILACLKYYRLWYLWPWLAPSNQWWWGKIHQKNTSRL